ncbi:MAG TPA: hypothetical protein VFC73_08050 [Syntrophomonadaceae bacterium]|nr:hypothetical protein [Syntrophomonadaceae bacterium]
MNININYLPNKTGIDLFQSLIAEIPKTQNQEIKLEGEDYLEINIKDEKNITRRIINTARAIKNSTDSEITSGILKHNGIASDLEANDPINRTYEVLICDLKVISIRLITYNKAKEQIKYIREAENSKVSEMAKKALYLIGLDIGVVSVVLTTKRRLKVRKINSSPIIRDKDLASIVKIIAELYEIEEKVQATSIKLGADPEFMLFNSKNGKMIAASEFFPRDGIIGTDNIRIPNRQQRPIAEVRPKPDDSPLELIVNIQQALASANRLAPHRNVKWVAGSQPMSGYSIGGHIHFSKIKVSGMLMRALDNYLGIPVFLIENPTTASKRRKKYGFLADYRLKDHGGFEYRSPGSWLVSQSIATAILCLAKIVVSRYPYLPKNYFNNLEAQKAFYSGDQEYFLKHFYKIWSDIENTDMYATYADELKVIPEMIMNGLKWDEKSDFRKSWKITVTNKAIVSEKRTKPTSSTISSSRTGSRENTRTPSVATRTTRISVTRSGAGRSNISGSVSASNINRGANNITRGRIISPGQVTRSQRIR